MTKFSALSAQDLRTKERNVGRLARKAKFIVQVEADDGSWFELDADNQDHAGVLARNQVDCMNSRGATCWCVVIDGELGAKPFYSYFAGLYQYGQEV